MIPRPLGALALSAATTAGSAHAQPQWEYSVSLYDWFTGLSSEVETRFGNVEAEQSFGDIREQLDIAAFARFEIRKGRSALVTEPARSLTASIRRRRKARRSLSVC